MNFLEQLTDSECDRWFVRLFVFLTLVQALIIRTTPFGLVPDEALYWAYSKHLDWSYYAKGPGIAIATWISTRIFGDTAFGVRIAALFCFSVFSASLYFFLRKLFSPLWALGGFVFVRFTLIFAFTGYIMTTDALVLPFWFGSIALAYLALTKRETNFWIGSLLLVGLGVLVKYTALILLPAYVIVLITSNELRYQLKSFGWWLGLGLMIVSLLPIFIWNAQHDWVNIGHNLSHTVSKQTGIPFRKLPELILSQIGLGGPIFFPVLCWALWRGSFSWVQKGDRVAGLWLMTTLPLLLVCIMVTATRTCYANWPLPAYVGGILLVTWELKKTDNWHLFSKLILSNAIICIPLQLSWYAPVFFPAKVSLPVPLRRMSGWKVLGTELSKKAEDLKQNGKSDSFPFILALDYMTEASLRFTVSPEIEVRLGSVNGRRLSEQDYWQSWDELLGRNAIVITTGDLATTQEKLLGWFKYCSDFELKNLPPPNRLAKPFIFFYCEVFNGRKPLISNSW